MYLDVFLATISISIVHGLKVTRDHIVHNDVNEHDVFLTNEDFKNARNFEEINLASLGITVPNDPTLAGNKFEGDIFGYNISYAKHLQRSAVSNPLRKWPNGEIPYVLSSMYGDYSKKMFAKVFQEYATKSCIRFVPRTREHKDYINIYPEDGCYSLVGRIGGRQPVSLTEECIQFGTIIHELMHVTGFFHEQSRTDRDEYVKIAFENIDRESKDQFEKYTTRTINDILPYDYGSIMHYGPYAFTKNGKRTISPLKSGGNKMGQRDGFSQLDLKKLNKLYDCTQIVTDGDEDESDTTDDIDCEDKKFSCTRWAENGDCINDRAYMLTNCPKTCRFCDKSDKNRGSIRTTMEPPTSTRASVTRRPSVTLRPSGTSRPETSGNCENKKRNCLLYASIGFCESESDKEYMSQNCAKACGLCQTISTTPSSNRRKPVVTTAVPDPVKPVNECENKYEYSCKLWAGMGDCENNESFMRQHCAKVCGFCGSGSTNKVSTVRPTLMPTETTTCQDKYSSLCKVWVQDGSCNRTRDFMKSYCPKSCGLCTSSGTDDEDMTTTTARPGTTARSRTTMRPVPTTSSSMTLCQDENPNCQKWADSGFCEKKGFSEFVKRTCAKSCGTCKSRYQRPKLFQ